MYDWPEVAGATDALWRAIAVRLADAGLAAPSALDRSQAGEAIWLDPNLVLSQTCGYPYATELGGVVRLVATPVYEAEGCEGPLYSSMVVARRGEGVASLADLSARRFAFNARNSLSGYVAPVTAMRGVGLSLAEMDWVETGSHRASVRAVADGQADAAAIDAVCWALAKRHEAEAAARLEVIDNTPLRPALPFITAGRRSPEDAAAIRNAMASALTGETGKAVRAALLLDSVVALTPADYASLSALSSWIPYD